MNDRTQFALGSRKVMMPRPMKRSLQAAIAILLTAAVALFVLVTNTALVGRGGTFAGFDIWLAFIRRTDILATMVLTAAVTILFVYWQRDRERR